MDTENKYRAIAFARARAIEAHNLVSGFFPDTNIRLQPTPALCDRRVSWTAVWSWRNPPRRSHEPGTIAQARVIASTRADHPTEAIDSLTALVMRLVAARGGPHA